MAVPLEVEEIAVGDYIGEEGYGHVIGVSDLGDSVRIIFVNGTEITPTKGTQMTVTQGSRW